MRAFEYDRASSLEEALPQDGEGARPDGLAIGAAATLGGNLLQRPRCWYFRNARTRCWLKGGSECQAPEGEKRNHALVGGGPCYAVYPPDPAAALSGTYPVAGPRGGRASRRTRSKRGQFRACSPGGAAGRESPAA